MDALIYSYVLGGIVFGFGLMVAFRQGYLGLRGRGLVHLMTCLGVLILFFAIQAWMQYAPMREAEPKTYSGGAEKVVGSPEIRRGSALDYSVVIGYFAIILGIGTWFGRRQKTLKDFFFGGQRFSWWLIACSLVATTVGSYSFVKYSDTGFRYGLSSSQTYLNDWIWFPLLAFGWLPILYFSRITTIPEYFERRFNSRVRFGATVCILIYMVGYVGVNLFTMGKVLNALLGWPIPSSALLVALISMSYVVVGGQTSVIMTDLFQGLMLLVAGFLILYLGIEYLGGFKVFWESLSREQRLAFPNFNEDPRFPSIGIFWQDALANSAMLYFLNQGMMMRFLAAKSLQESRKAALGTIVLLMVVAACVVGAGGWVASALVRHGDLPADLKPDQAFYVATEFLMRPGVFGLVLAALTAALMSTVDTLITAISALTVNDLYKRHLRPKATDTELMRVARLASVAVALFGVVLVPVFMNFSSLYEAHGAFTAAVTPPLVVTLLLAVFWRRFTASAAFWTITGGLAAMALSIFLPQVIEPFAQGVPGGTRGEGFLGGMNEHKFMRACYGILVCLGIGVGVTWVTRPEPEEKQRGLVWGTVDTALRRYKGSPGTEQASRLIQAEPYVLSEQPSELRGEGQLPVVSLSASAAEQLQATPGDLLYLTDTRPWLGGLRSTHALVGDVTPESGPPRIGLNRDTHDSVVTSRRQNKPVRIEKLY